MFDPAGEKAFIEECHEMLRTKTVILITHRPASLALADRTLRLEPGRQPLVVRRQRLATATRHLENSHERPHHPTHRTADRPAQAR